MAHNNNQCIAREYLNFEYSCRLEERWLCKQCYKERQTQNAQIKNHYRNHEDAAKILEKDLQNFKKNRQSLLLHLYKLFNQYPISYNCKIQFAKEISMINALFLEMRSNPFNEQELRKLDDILNRIRDINGFYKLTEFEIKQILSIGRGHYQCDNGKIQQILNIMMKIDELKSSNLVINLKLITNQSEGKLCYSQQYDQLRFLDTICVSCHLLFAIIFPVYPVDELYQGLQDITYIYALKNVNNNPKNYFKQFMKFNPVFFNQTESIICNSILIIQFKLSEVYDNKTYILRIKSKKIIRSFKNMYEVIQYDQNNNQLIAIKNFILYFYDLNTLKLKNQIKVYKYLENISYVSSIKKVFSLIDKQLAVFDIDKQRLINSQRLNYKEILKYHINQQYNMIVLLFENKIVILDFNFTQLKCIDWISQEFNLFRTQVSEDMKYLYSYWSMCNFEVFKMSLAN